MESNSTPTANFYCQIRCEGGDFSISEWNKAYKEIQAMPISEEAKHKLIHPEPCKAQCEACMDIVIETKKKNKEKYGW